MAESASATTASQLAFTTEPDTGAGGVATGVNFATQPVVTIEDSSNATVDSSDTITLSLTGPGGAALNSGATLSCDQTSGGVTSVTANNGVANFTGCSISTGGSYTLTASDAAASLSEVSQSLLITGAAQLAFTETGSLGGGSTATWTNQPVVAVQDANGNLVSGSMASIALSIVPGTGTLGATLSCSANPVTAVAGVANFSGCSIDKAGTNYELIATDAADGIRSAPSPEFDITTGSATQLVFSIEPAGAPGGDLFSKQPVVTVEDAGGNQVAGNSDQISLAITSDTGTAGAKLTCAPQTASNGVATFSGCSIDKAGSGYTLTATDNANSVLTGTSSSFEVTTGGPAIISFIQSPGGGNGGAAWSQQPEVSLTDSGGNPADGAVKLSIEPDTGSPGAALSCQANPLGVTAGVADFADCSINQAGDGYVLVATSGALQTDSAPFSVSSGAAAHLSFSIEPGPGTGGSALGPQPSVAVTDTGGNPAGGAVKLSITPGTGTPGAKLTCDNNSVAAVSGTANFLGCAIDEVGTGYSLTATIGNITTISTSFDVTLGLPAELSFVTQPGGGTGGTPWLTQPEVLVEDAGGNQLPSDSASIALSVAPGTGTGALSCSANPLPATRGAAQFGGCEIDKVGASYELLATDATDGLSVSSEPFAVTAGPPAQLVFTTQPGGATSGGVWPAQPAVAVADAGGNPVPGSSASVALSITPGTGAPGAKLSCASNPVAAVSGTASFAGCSINKAAGGYDLTATDAADGLKGESLSFSVLLPPPLPLGEAPTAVPTAQTFGGAKYAANPTDVVDDVNTATGSLTFSLSDLTVAGIGEPFVLQRTYNSADSTGGSFGPGWSSIFDLGVTIAANHSTALVRGEDGQQLVFTWNAHANAWVPPAGARASLNCTVSGCSVTRFDGVRWDTKGAQLVDYLAADGQGLKFSYGAHTVTVTVETTGSKPLQVVATLNATGQVTNVATPTRSVSYGYTNGLLTSFTDADNNTWTYAYSGGLLTTETDPLGNARLVVSYASGRVASASEQGGPRHTDDTFTWNATTHTATRLALANAGGTLVSEPYVDQYLNNSLISQTLPSGAVTRYSYDAQENLIEVQDPTGWVQQMYYDPSNNLVSQLTPISSTSAAVVNMTYNFNHEVVAETDADGNTTSYSFNNGLLQSAVEPNGAVTTYRYNSVGELTMAITPIGEQAFSYDAAGNRTGVVLETPFGQSIDGRGTLASYNEAGKEISSVDPRGNLSSGINPAYETTWSYDADGNLLSQTVPGPQTTTYTYDAASDLTGTTSPGGASTTYSWNEASLTRTTTSPAGSATQTYDPSGDLLVEADPGNHTTTHIYNSAGLEVRTINPDASTVNYTYDIEGDVVAITDSAGNVLTDQYDSLNRVIRSVDNGAVTLFSYDPAGNVTSTTDPDGAVTVTTYNSLGKVSSVTNGAGTSLYGYDAVGDLVSRTDPNHHATYYTYDSAAREISMSVNNVTTTYGYDLAGNLSTTTDPDGRTTSYTYNAENLPTETVQSWSGHPSLTTTESYNAAGQRTQMVDPNGTVHNYTYDASGNLTSASDGSETFTYDHSNPGEILETYPDGTKITYNVNDAGDLLSVQAGQSGQPGFAEASYILNAGGQQTGVAFSNGLLETDQVNQQGEVTDQTLQIDDTAIADDAFTYDAAGNRLSETDTVDGTTTSNTYGYDSAERLTSFNSTTGPAVALTTSLLSASLVASAPSVSGGASLDSSTSSTSPAPGSDLVAPPASAGSSSAELTAAITPLPVAPNSAPQYQATGATTAYKTSALAVPSVTTDPPATFDAASIPTSTPTDSYGYDGAGNITSTASPAGTTQYSYNSADEVTSETGPKGKTTWSYDKNGDVTQIAGPTKTQVFTYDAADHLVGVSTTTGSNTTTVTYTYDGDGNRVSSTVGGVVTNYVWDPIGQYPELALVLNGSGGLISRFIYGNGPVAMQTPAGTSFYSLDPLGSAAELTNSAGAIVAAYHYDPFGNVTTVGANPPANPLLFQGQYLDPNTGLYDLRARNYDPTTGRFTQRDPVAPAEGTPVVSPYVFANDRPTVFTDPGGTSPTATSIFLGHSNTAANAGADTKYGTVLLNLTIKAVSKLGGYSAAAENAALSGKVGIEIDPETADLAEVGETASKAGIGLAVIGIGLQSFVTVEDCLHGPLATCVGEAVGTAVNIAFTVGCTALTAGIGAVACGLVGAGLSFALQYVISNYGPQIVAGIVELADATAVGVSNLAQQTAKLAVEAGDAIAGAATTAGETIVSGINEATAAISSGLQGALATLTAAGYTAVQLAGVLVNTFKEAINQVIGGLVSLGYDVASITEALANEFSETASQVVSILKNTFGYTATQIMSALDTVYGLGDQAAAALLQAANFAVDAIASALNTVYGDVASAVASVLNALDYGVNQIGAALDQALGVADALAASILSGLGFAVDQIAGVLQTIYSDLDSAAAAALKAAGFAVDAVATALSDVFQDVAQVAAGILKGIGFAVDAVAQALSSVYSLLQQGVAQILENVGYLVDDVATALSDVFGDLAQQAAQVLTDIGYAVDDVATALENVFSQAAQQAAQILKDIGDTVDQIATALSDVFTDPAQAAAQILEAIGYAVDDVATALEDVFSQAAEQVAQILKNLGYAVDDIATALENVFGELAQATAQILKDIGYVATEIATALENVFGEVANAVGSILQAIGEAAADIANVLENIFGEVASAVGSFLESLGFSSSTIDAIGGALASFGQDVANCFTSGFTDC
jgi:RHS repeat-associated protein